MLCFDLRRDTGEVELQMKPIMRKKLMHLASAGYYSGWRRAEARQPHTQYCIRCPIGYALCRVRRPAPVCTGATGQRDATDILPCKVTILVILYAARNSEPALLTIIDT